MVYTITQLVCIIGLLMQKVSSFSTDWTTEFDYYTYLDEDELFRLYWNNLDGDIIEFGMEASATGWIALGVSPNGQMPGSDIAMGWVDDDGKIYLEDRYTIGRSTPLLESNQNLTLISGEEADGMTRIRFKRPKYTCNENDIQLSQGTTRLIWAFHASEDPDKQCFDSDGITFHTNKGAQSLNLNTGIQLPVDLEDDVVTIEITMDEVAVPSKDTTYWCKLFELPQTDDNSTRHVVKFDPVVQEGNEGTVHHLLAYICHEFLVRPGDVGTEGVCDFAFRNMPAEDCRGSQLIYAWAIGGEPLYMPEDIGFPIGGVDGPKYIMMEMHYDNPKMESDIVDSSGFRMYVTEQLRDIDAGVMQIGSFTDELGNFIPPGLSYAHNQAFMPGNCTKAVIPETGINIFANILHEHTIGVAATLRVVRDDVEIDPIDSNWNYDFNYQNSILFEPEKKLYPGDTLILDCYFDSTNRSYLTIGGESTSEEMCFSFFFYYPAVKYVGSSSGKSPNALFQWIQDAYIEGYIYGNLSTNITGNLTFDNVGFDMSKDGALEFYNRLWNSDYPQYDENYMSCYDSPANATVDIFTIGPIPSGFEAADPNIFECDGTITGNDDDILCPFDTATIDNAIVVNMFIPIFIPIFVGFLEFFFV